MKEILTHVLIALLLPLTACQTSTTQLPTGVSATYSGYVPARIAVLPCHKWPDAAHFAYQGLSNIGSDIQTDLCNKFDEFVIGGFKDQPYMRGFSPASVEKLLASTEHTDLYKNVTASWGLREDSCLACRNPQSYYVTSIAPRQEWRAWLNAFSSSVRYADAVLLPFVVMGNEKIYNDRGVTVYRRSAAITLLLIDTANGFLLWAGGRESDATKQLFPTNPNQLTASQTATYPEWSIVHERLFTEDVWKDFPGRQVYR